ncbi:MAG TPA: vanadium-dependent haloperoxidase [Chitinophagaceae bacterium]|nr:vanadium-dependent haloperoxidase [Chitinophagaceae bacterium]
MRSFLFHLMVLAEITFAGVGCGSRRGSLPKDTDVLHANQERLTQVIIYDIFTPPVAARIYAYTSLASYEAIRFASPGAPSLTARMHGFAPMPLPDTGKAYDFTLAASRAFFTVARKVVFSVDSLADYEQGLMKQYQDALDPATYDRSVRFGDSVGQVVLARANADNYLQTRGKPKFLGSNEPGKWHPTPPDYLDGVEWCWNTMKTLVMDSASQFRPVPPPPFSLDSTSEFFKGVMDVYQTSRSLTEEQKTIALYWDDNSFTMQHAGHLMFGNKKITPGGHWMGITAIACRQSGADAVKTARAYALTATALFEGFISCWDEKYRSSVIRPVSVINEHIDHDWVPLLQTPSFPEYTSAHSTITGAAAVVLTRLFGDQFAFQDTSDLRYIGMQRHFASFLQAADETSISRLYGGIHYRLSVNRGAECGRRIGAFIVQRLYP